MRDRRFPRVVAERRPKLREGAVYDARISRCCRSALSRRYKLNVRRRRGWVVNAIRQRELAAFGKSSGAIRSGAERRKLQTQLLVRRVGFDLADQMMSLVPYVAHTQHGTATNLPLDRKFVRFRIGRHVRRLVRKRVR